MKTNTRFSAIFADKQNVYLANNKISADFILFVIFCFGYLWYSDQIKFLFSGYIFVFFLNYLIPLFILLAVLISYVISSFFIYINFCIEFIIRKYLAPKEEKIIIMIGGTLLVILNLLFQWVVAYITLFYAGIYFSNYFVGIFE